MTPPYGGLERFPVRVTVVTPGEQRAGGGVVVTPADPYAVPFVPDQAPVTLPQTGIMTRPWLAFLRRVVGITQHLADELQALPTVAGTTGQVQVNSAGAFGAIPEGSAGQVLTSQGVGVAPVFKPAPGGGGNVTGPASASAGDVPVYADATGKVISDSGIPGIQVARRDQGNTFLGTQIINAPNSILELIDSTGAADQRIVRLFVSGGQFYVDTVNDAATVEQSQMHFDRAGNLNVSGAMGSPAGYYEQNRGVANGRWVDVPYAASNYAGMTVGAGNVSTHAYTLLGNTAVASVGLANVTYGGAGNVTVAFPLTATRQSVGPVWFYLPGIGWELGVATTTVGQSYVTCNRASAAAMPVGVGNVYFTIPMSV